MMFNLMDDICATALNVSVDEYIKKIESAPIGIAEEIINEILLEDDGDIEKSIKLFSDL